MPVVARVMAWRAALSALAWAALYLAHDALARVADEWELLPHLLAPTPDAVLAAVLALALYATRFVVVLAAPALALAFTLAPALSRAPRRANTASASS